MGNNEVKNRLITLINKLCISKAEFERECGLSNGYVNSIKNSIGSKGVALILRRYPEVNKSWLVLGEGEMLKPTAAADGELPITTGEGSVLINSGGSRVDTNSGAVIYKALDEIAEQRKLTAKAHEQIDRLLAIIDRLTSGVNNNNQ